MEPVKPDGRSQGEGYDPQVQTREYEIHQLDGEETPKEITGEEKDGNRR
ncbi:MAG: hypothetical protein AB4352_08105 [Hormoscilla sp.]